MKELLCDPDFWVGLFGIFMLIVIPAVVVVRWIHHLNRLKRTQGTPKIRKTIFWNIVGGFLLYVLHIISPERGSRLRHKSWTTQLKEETKEFKRLAEVEELKKRPCEAKLPDAPRWHCTCGRINEPHTATCVCGQQMRNVPDSHKYPAPKETVWHCTCGRENPSYTSTCVCGQAKRKVQP